MRRAWLGFGGNIGDVEAALRVSLTALDDHRDCAVDAVSPLYKTPPWGLLNQPPFLNCCAQIRTTLEPEALLDLCQNIELTGKRERLERWGPRTIDIDMLVFEGVEQDSDKLTLPHPRMQDRAFVMLPLSDISPDLQIAGRSVAEILADLDTNGIEPVLSVPDWWRAS
ncbi:2-amino-4-hydroxy-6-hydroxymethyldihydropteridine diphosphokinase [Ahrensia sp. R2A130]|uniref:2-amino-4-hydroxy-6- hydroxymethyldihydropteridine diphosphokinase n=1 Tax=Ahrensia sp. R2A130 TaxID=744979 RepID=UPI0001E0F064|nr:2-amino-4-hydroxy-6-hydroxymethyldihydropteridine diphosphokinase [Ahrensia sp. R2A130]EFL90414.1 2-amino-4-hydroxy-6-hydroxymethyldihydropteridine pyrophosphokinase [Ahrensia sp. R2A130]